MTEDQNTRAPVVSSQAGERRASIARIIDPALFERFDRVAAQGRTAANGRRWEEVCYREAIDRTLAKADDILALTPAPGGMGDLADEQLAKWHREWHWKDCERESIDHSIYPRDLRMLKAFIEHCNLRTAALSAEVRERSGHYSLRENFTKGKFDWQIVEIIPEWQTVIASFGADRERAEAEFRSLAQTGGKL